MPAEINPAAMESDGSGIFYFGYGAMVNPISRARRGVETLNERPAILEDFRLVSVHQGSVLSNDFCCSVFLTDTFLHSLWFMVCIDICVWRGREHTSKTWLVCPWRGYGMQDEEGLGTFERV